MTKEFKLSNKTYKRINEWQSYIVFILLFLVVHAFFKIAFVPSRSMYPTLAKKELLFCSYQEAEDLDYGDIVIFHPEDGKSTLFVKRLIGKPGDVITIQDGYVYRNGVKLDEPYLMEERINGEFPSYTMDEEMYFFMGDNRNNSLDSRFFGAIPAKQIVGRVLFHLRIFPDDELLDLQEKLQNGTNINGDGIDSEQYIFVK